jgi:hypothetical protein
MGKNGGSIDVGLVVDIGEYKAQLDLGKDAIAAFKSQAVTQLQELQSVSAASLARVSDNVKSMSTSVSNETMRAANAMLAYKSAQDQVRASSILVKKATGEDLVAATKLYGAAVENAANKLREMAEAQEIAGVGAAALAGNTNEAKASLALMSEELGVKMNRHMRGFIADLPIVGSLMSSAFSALAVVGLVQILDQIPGAIDKIVEKLSGWDKEAQAEYADQVKQNQDLIKLYHDIAIARLRFAEIGLEGAKKTEQAIKDDQSALTLYTQWQNEAIHKQLQLKALLEGTHLETTRVGTGRGTTEKTQIEVKNSDGIDSAELAQKKTELKAVTEELQKYEAEIKRLQEVKIPELKLGLGPEQAREAERAAEKIKQAETKLFEFRKKNLEATNTAERQVDTARESAARRDLELTIASGELKQAEAQKEIDVNNLVIDGIVQHAKAEYDIKKESLDLQLAQRKITAQQEIQILNQEEEQIYRLEKKRLENLLTIAKGEAKEEQKIKNQLQALDDQHTLKQVQNAKKVADAQKKAALDSLHKWHSFFDQVNQNFKTALNGWLQGTQSFGDAMQKMWQSVAAAIIEQLLEIALKYIEYELLMKVFKIESEKAKAMVGIKSSAAQAGAGGVASMAAAPYPIDMTAPAFGAAMSGAASVYSAVGIAERGALVPKNMPIFAHAEEMILPAGISRALKGLVETGSLSGKNSGGGISFSPSLQASAMDTRGLEPMLRDFERRLLRTFKGIVKNNRLNLSQA